MQFTYNGNVFEAKDEETLRMLAAVIASAIPKPEMAEKKEKKTEKKEQPKEKEGTKKKAVYSTVLTCEICSKEFRGHSMSKTCSRACRLQKRKEYTKNWLASKEKEAPVVSEVKPYVGA